MLTKRYTDTFVVRDAEQFGPLTVRFAPKRLDPRMPEVMHVTVDDEVRDWVLGAKLEIMEYMASLAEQKKIPGIESVAPSAKSGIQQPRASHQEPTLRIKLNDDTVCECQYKRVTSDLVHEQDRIKLRIKKVEVAVMSEPGSDVGQVFFTLLAHKIKLLKALPTPLRKRKNDPFLSMAKFDDDSD